MNSLRLAMWSGPRNISTAMMRSWENRGDTFVCDEPFYAHYLDQTKLSHPGADVVIAHGDTDWRRVARWLTGPIPEGRQHWYQKQMAHHMLPNMDLEWSDDLTNCFLIRPPAEMLTSLIEFIPLPTVFDTGLAQQVQLFERVQQRTGRTPVVIDARDVLVNPRELLGRLCDAVGVPFTDRMLHWPPGRRATDGIWATWWYAKVEQTTGFEPYRPKSVTVPDTLRRVLAECEPLYERLYGFRLR